MFFRRRCFQGWACVVLALAVVALLSAKNARASVGFPLGLPIPLVEFPERRERISSEEKPLEQLREQNFAPSEIEEWVNHLVQSHKAYSRSA